MAKTSKSKSEGIVQPIIRTNGENHLLEDLFEGDPKDLPEVKSVGYMRLHQGQSGWVSYVITTKGKEVVKFEVSEPDLRAIVEDAAKINFVTQFIDQEAF